MISSYTFNLSRVIVAVVGTKLRINSTRTNVMAKRLSFDLGYVVYALEQE